MSEHLKIISPKDTIFPEDKVINTTSRSKTWSRGLSPFFLGPLKLYGDYISQNMEAAWQNSKVYIIHCDETEEQNPTKDYFEWAKAGWDNPKAVRYPMGKGAVPMYSWWDGQKLTYTEAREKIYIPLYRQIAKTKAFEYLKMEYNTRCIKNGEALYLWDFDGYDHKAIGKSYYEVMTDPKMKMGHSFILGALLEFGENFTIEDLK